MDARVRPRLQRGAITLEFILVLPFIVIITWGTFQYTILFLVQNTLTHAATVAAREAAKHEPVEEVALVVDAILDEVHCMNIADEDGNPLPESGVRVVQEVGSPEGGPIITSFGDEWQACQPPEYPPVRPDEVRVTVCMDLARSPICNFLFHFGVDELSWSDKRLEISALVKKQ